MKKKLILVIFIFFASLLTAEVNEPKKIFKLQRAYIYLEEALLISESDLNCSYFIKDSMPQAMEIVASYHPDQQRVDFSDSDRLFVNQGARDGLKEGEMLLIMNRGRQIHGLGRYIQKKSLAEITRIYEDKALISLKSGCHPVNIGDLAVPFTPEKTVFAKKIDYLFARIPENPVSGAIVYNDLTSWTSASISSTSQYVTVDLGKGVVDKGSYLLICRILKADLPPLIIGLGIVIHAENTNSTVKILDSNSDIRVNDEVMLLAAPKADAAGADRTDNIPIVETLQAETQGEENAQPGDAAAAEQAFDGLTVDVLFEFDGKEPKG
ncbi:MAG TPA: hypothetical protein VLQ89_00895, partial [Candidatus Binatia bacterium]|nr:hypothetical protein [Candidatus Binatia bacterium]